MIHTDGIIDSCEIPDKEVVKNSPEGTRYDMKSVLGIRELEDSDIDYEDEEGYDYGNSILDMSYGPLSIRGNDSIGIDK